MPPTDVASPPSAASRQASSNSFKFRIAGALFLMMGASYYVAVSSTFHSALDIMQGLPQTSVLSGALEEPSSCTEGSVREEGAEQHQQQHLGGEFKLPALLDDNAIQVSYEGSKELQSPLCCNFFGGHVCKHIMGNFTHLPEFNSHSTLINVSFSCKQLFQDSWLGTGNYVSAFYGLRMVAHTLGTTDVSILCNDAEETKKNLILPWVMGMFPQLIKAENATKEDLPTLKEACSDYNQVPIGYRWKDMQYEMQRLAIAMVGIPSPEYPSAVWAEENLWSEDSPHQHGRDYYQLAAPQKGEAPLFPDTELDDTLLHFRCGDLIHSNHKGFGFMKFGSFLHHVSPDVRTIGVATQPFDPKGQNRPGDAGLKMKRCKQVTMAFIEHLQAEFPNAQIRVHNDINETIALTFARMIMANQTVVAITSFSVFPGVSTFGTGYI